MAALLPPLDDLFAALRPVGPSWVLPAVFTSMMVSVTSLVERWARLSTPGLAAPPHLVVPPPNTTPPVDAAPAAVRTHLVLQAELRDVLAGVRAEAAAANVQLELAIPAGLAVRAELGAVRSVLQALLRNAIAHAPGGRVFVGAIRADGGVRIMVIDDGKAAVQPIGPELRAPLARLLVLSGAALMVDHRPGDGTTVMLSLPDTE
jgi:hypothetical protein